LRGVYLGVGPFLSGCRLRAVFRVLSSSCAGRLRSQPQNAVTYPNHIIPPDHLTFRTPDLESRILHSKFLFFNSLSRIPNSEIQVGAPNPESQIRIPDTVFGILHSVLETAAGATPSSSLWSSSSRPPTFPSPTDRRRIRRRRHCVTCSPPVRLSHLNILCQCCTVPLGANAVPESTAGLNPPFNEPSGTILGNKIGPLRGGGVHY